MPSFDIVSHVDLQEVDNAVNQARKEVDQRYDFKGTATELVLEKTEIRINSSDDFRVKAVVEVLQAKMARRQVPLKALVYGKVEPSELPLTEDSPLRPASPYAASKVAADYLGLQAWLGRGLPVLRVRAFNHLGPGQTDKFVAPALASRIAL